ncbi:NAD(P)H-dependent oxidoreductase [Siphonobacter sp. SORGH_AS_0500]|uniref:NAD(P)H-dependent oxidoreductase n=1 Tax=Siphonobacter sp. SORGH_AS_0500 TaxID=1864824 RepID=UPI002857670F|nr:NAD(P)H-dependent oxidoreductase [Siphonobacter sp. SORGH_AS_0500]MDR6196410.1 NAD(P)H dehydrogenase (quinone) [Siphonobacter sp. SORGH_AS_0500]
MKKILIINGHPDRESYNYALSEAYRTAAIRAGAELTQINIADLQFDPNLRFGYRKRMELEPDLVEALQKIKEAEHIVWFFPMWWYSYPAVMKGFVDRLFLPGIVMKFIEGKPFPEKLLKGRTARIVITADTPSWYDRFFMGRPAINQFKKGTLEFCGIHPVSVTYIAPIKASSERFREKWLAKVSALGLALK